MSIASKLVSKVKKASKKSPESKHMEELAVSFYRQNAAANAAKRAAEKAREALFAEMKKAGIASFHVQDELVSLEAKISSSTKNVVDIAELAELVAPQTFLKIVSATQKSVIEHAGSDVAMRCLKQIAGDENVSVTTVK